MLCACIDIGSNTTRLLVARAADGRLQEVMQQRAFTKLGSARAAVRPEKIAQVAAVVAEQVRLARDCGAEALRAVGTHAIRQAENRDELLAAIHAASGLHVDVLSGEEEARYAFIGATQTLPSLPAGRLGVVDVGGGSTELVCGTLADGVTWARSFGVGSGTLADAHLKSDPPTPAELDAVREHVAEVLGGLDAPRPAAAYAVGGSATSLCRLVGDVLDREALDRGVAQLAALPAAEAARKLDLHVDRVRLLPAGILVLAAAGEIFGTTLQIARGGLREGVLLDQALFEGAAA